ncbi:MAG: polyisoprenoid-binding protein [Chryseobacterium sp. SCN 40-13]|nr:MAG: polyisoprenoid-binding protein [Chryseobacterium sp. SCN 40-13]
MKNKFIIAGLSLALLSAVSCGKDKTITNEVSEVETTQDGQVYLLDTANSKIEWKGYKVFKSENTSHFGTIMFDEGSVTVKDGKLESGKFVANMNSLESVDLKDEAESKGKLEGHLKSADFFETEQHPTATYEITKVSDATDGGDFNAVLDGNLTIKGITKPTQFKANVAVNDGEVSISTEPTDINREEFGANFQSPAENGVIKNEVTLQIHVKAQEQK